MVNKLRNNEKLQSIKVADVDVAIQMLNKYMDAQVINPYFSAKANNRGQTTITQSNWLDSLNVVCPLFARKPDV